MRLLFGRMSSPTVRPRTRGRKGTADPAPCRLGDTLTMPSRPCTSAAAPRRSGVACAGRAAPPGPMPASRGRSAASVRIRRDVSVESTSFWISGTVIVGAQVVGRHLEQGRVGVGHDVRRPRAAGQRGDLAEEVAVAHRRQAAVAAVLGDAGGGRPIEDEVRRRRGVAVLDDACAGRHLADRRVADERVALFGRAAARTSTGGRPGGRSRRASPARSGVAPSAGAPSASASRARAARSDRMPRPGATRASTAEPNSRTTRERR